jgi:hypothetical protein
VERNVPEVRIGTQEYGIEIETRLRDDAIDGPAHGDALLPQDAEQTCGSDVALHSRLNRWQGLKNSPGPLEAFLGPESLKHFSDDDRDGGQIFLVPKRRVEA